MIQSIWWIAKKEILTIFRDKTWYIQLFLPIFIFPVLSLGISFFSQGGVTSYSTLQIAVSQENMHSRIISDYIEYYSETPIELIKTAEPIELLKNNKVDMVICEDESKTIHLIYNSSSLLSRITATGFSEKFNSYLSRVNQEKYPLTAISILEDETGRDGTDVASMFTLLTPCIILLLLLHGNTAFANDLFAGEKERKTLEMLFLSGVNKIPIFLGKITALIFIGGLELIVCSLSYAFSLLLMPTNSAMPLFLLTGLPVYYFFCAVISIFSVILLLSFITAFVSLVSKNMKMSQMLNEMIIMIPILFSFCFTFGIFQVNEKHCIIPIFNGIDCFFASFSGTGNIISVLCTFVINIILCRIILLASQRYMNSEYVFSH